MTDVIVTNPLKSPEDNAAVLAWYSRSPAGYEELLGRLERVGSGSFMDRIFIQYGHGSVGDLGHLVVSLEGVSMLAAKAFEDTPLFNGQECSSRYLDFSTVEYKVDPELQPPQYDRATELQSKLRDFYVRGLAATKAMLVEQYPKEPEESESVYEKAINARAFDIMRGFLPCGATTNVAWYGSLRTIKERCELLMHHPLHEVRVLALSVYRKAYELAPHSFNVAYCFAESKRIDPKPMLEELEGPEVFQSLSCIEHFYADSQTYYPEDMGEGYTVNVPELLDEIGLVETPSTVREFKYVASTSNRARKTPLPRHFRALLSSFTFQGTLDFGSFRDLHRHRGGYCSMPIVTPTHGFHTWYYNSLPKRLQQEADSLVKEVQGECSPDTMLSDQYFIPMGFLVPVTLEYSPDQAIYVAELRSGQSVHPTLRVQAQRMAEILKGYGLPVYYDARDDVWSTRRGNQDIILK